MTDPMIQRIVQILAAQNGGNLPPEMMNAAGLGGGGGGMPMQNTATPPVMPPAPVGPPGMNPMDLAQGGPMAGLGGQPPRDPRMFTMPGPMKPGY